jgi:hypothetical protein
MFAITGIFLMQKIMQDSFHDSLYNFGSKFDVHANINTWNISELILLVFRMNNDVTPPIWHYGISVLIIVFGFAAFSGLIYNGIANMQSDLAQIIAPSDEKLNFEKPGEYIVFYENNSMANGRYYSTGEEFPPLRLSVRKMATGEYLSVYPAKESLTYAMGSRSGRSIMAFNVISPGIYEINTTYSGSSGSEIVLAIGTGIKVGLLTTVLLSLVVIFGSIALAAVIAYSTYRKRERALSRKKDEEMMMKGSF